MTLARPVYSCASGSRVALLQRHAMVTERIRAGLERAGVFAVYVEDVVSEGIEPADPVSAEVREEAVRGLDETFRRVARDGTSTRIPGEQIEHLSTIVRRLLADLRRSGGLAASLMDLHAFDAHTLTHSLNVCVIGLMVGDRALRLEGWRDHTGRTRRDGHDERLEKLALGLLLHDVGKLVIPSAILQKPGPLTADEMAIVREHPQAGIDMIERDAVSSLSRAAIIGHHERVDGNGYPFGRRGDELHPFAQIAAIADVYDAVSSMRVYQARRPTHEAWELVMSLAGTAFPLDLVRVFKTTVAPYPEGVAVRLSDGRRGLVAKVSREYVTRPLVRITHDPEGDPVTPHDLPLFDHPDVTILDTLPDLDAVGETPPARPAPPPGAAEVHEQRLARVLA